MTQYHNDSGPAAACTCYCTECWRPCPAGPTVPEPSSDCRADDHG